MHPASFNNKLPNRNTSWIGFTVRLLVGLIVYGAILHIIGGTAMLSCVAPLVFALILYKFISTRPGSRGIWLEEQEREQAERLQREQEAQQRAAAEVAYNADRAIAQAGNTLAATPFWLEDIGLLLYNDTQTPVISREEAICGAGAHLRPYVILSCPYSMGDTLLTVSFSLSDDQDQVVYAAQINQPLADGSTFLTPQTWVRIPDDQAAGKWSLRVSIKGYGLLAVHEFKWWRGDQELHFTSDGEIDPRIVELLMQRLAEPVEDESISLDELLAQQKGNG